MDMSSSNWISPTLTEKRTRLQFILRQQELLALRFRHFRVSLEVTLDFLCAQDRVDDPTKRYFVVEVPSCHNLHIPETTINIRAAARYNNIRKKLTAVEHNVADCATERDRLQREISKVVNELIDINL